MQLTKLIGKHRHFKDKEYLIAAADVAIAKKAIC